MNKELIEALDKLSYFLSEESDEINSWIDSAKNTNTWFTQAEIKRALSAWSESLKREQVENWVSAYDIKEVEPKKIGLVLAGNIPMVGFHDVLTVLLSGHIAYIKLSSQDNVLIVKILEYLIKELPSVEKQIVYAERLNDVDAVIATGSNNTAQHFEQYFKSIPKIIRRNRNSIAVLNGEESFEDVQGLGFDIFSYYGQGCRNVSKLYMPKEYDITKLLDQLQAYEYVIDHHKYFNNYNYYKSIYLVNREEHLDTGYVMLRESKDLQAPLSVIYYERYDSIENLESSLNEIKDTIQCVVSNMNLNIESPIFKFGDSQCPALNDYADGVDTMQFLIKYKY
ncbi:MAG: acyl-CoA reductase [bacterium]